MTVEVTTEPSFLQPSLCSAEPVSIESEGAVGKASTLTARFIVSLTHSSPPPLLFPRIMLSHDSINMSQHSSREEEGVGDWEGG